MSVKRILAVFTSHLFPAESMKQTPLKIIIIVAVSPMNSVCDLRISQRIPVLAVLEAVLIEGVK